MIIVQKDLLVNGRTCSCCEDVLERVFRLWLSLRKCFRKLTRRNKTFSRKLKPGHLYSVAVKQVGTDRIGAWKRPNRRDAS